MNKDDRLIPLQEGAIVITTGAEISWNGEAWIVHKFLDTSEPPYIKDNMNKVVLEDGVPYEVTSIEDNEFYDPMYPKFLECHTDHVVLRANDIYTDEPVEHTITVEDVRYFGNSGSGMSCLGTVMGDHRMLCHIHEDVVDYFMQEHPENFTPEERERWKGMQ